MSRPEAKQPGVPSLVPAAGALPLPKAVPMTEDFLASDSNDDTFVAVLPALVESVSVEISPAEDDMDVDDETVLTEVPSETDLDAEDDDEEIPRDDDEVAAVVSLRLAADYARILKKEEESVDPTILVTPSIQGDAIAELLR